MSLKRLSGLTCIFTLLITGTVYGLAFNGLEATPTNVSIEYPNSFYYELKPEGTINDSLTISNTSDEIMKIRIYATDTTINNQGATVLKAYNEEKKEVGAWINFDKETEKQLTLAPKEKQNINFTITVPANAEQKIYFGGVLVENLNTSDKEMQDNFVIKTNSRLGLTTKVKVTDDPQPVKKTAPGQSSASPTPWTQIYFYVSLGLFVVVIGAFAVNALRKKKHAHHKK